MRQRVVLVILATVVFAPHAWGDAPAVGTAPAVETVVERVNSLLAQETQGDSADQQPAAKVDEATLLRRLYLDTVGHPPTPEEITAFALDLSADKRQAAAARLLARKEFGENWARYWRDVILYRRSEERALLVSNSLVKFLSDAFNHDPHWDKIARRFITATGDVREEGATAIIMAQAANAEDTTAEISRIFLGIQIQCAQCHDHPTDRWKREQFHQLAAFFPRVSIRAVRDGEQRSFAVASADRAPRNATANPRRGKLEHRMPDLNKPEEPGKVMKPVFFVTGQKLDLGEADLKRREQIARWMTGAKNPWFAKAFVNRMWSELVGRGFYEPVDDIGPDRECSAPQTLDYLSEQFVASGYDIKWLISVITASDAYGQQSRSRAETEDVSMPCNCPQRLRGDQLFNALAEVLGISETAERGRERGYRPNLNTPRARLNLTFGYDPSNPRDEIAGSIPQALYLMNAAELQREIDGKRRGTELAKLLNEIPDDKALVSELYLRSLAREPKPAELQTCLEHVQAAGDRAEAFEDILWSLVNSTEFLNRQ